MNEKLFKNHYKIECSIIVTSFNQAHTISQTLDSIISQYRNFPIEIIIGDDCSTDSTREICMKYQKCYQGIIKLMFQENNIGVAANFASCVKQANGNYIAICAADDFWHNPNKLKMQVDYLSKNPDCGLLYTDYDKLNVTSGKITKDYIKTSRRKIYEGKNLIQPFFKGLVPALTLTVMFRKDLFDKYVPADDYIKYRFPSEDWITWLILSKFSKVGYLPVSTATYRYGKESLSNITQYTQIEKRYEKEQSMYKYLCDLFPDDLHYDEKGYLIYAIGIYLSLAYKRGDYPSSLKYASQLQKLGYSNIKTKMAKYRLTFYIFHKARQLKQKIFN